jgi:hypothetical protein
MMQGTLTEGESSVLLASKLRYAVLYEKKYTFSVLKAMDLK